MKSFKRIFIIIILFLIYLFISVFSYSNAVTSDISNSVLRLHVIANSDSSEDQDLKYKVRDSLIEYMNLNALNINSKEDAIDFVNNNINELYAIAQKTISDNGFDYPVNIIIGNSSFPTKTYGDISLPSGYYDSIKVEIGNSCGKNWWCVMFPTLCFVDVTNGIVPDDSKEQLQSVLTDEDYSLISSEEIEYKVKFKLVELFENAKIIIAKK